MINWKRMEGESNMKEFTAKELENIFSKKQLSAYNQKLKREYYLLKMDYEKIIETRESYIEKEISKREEKIEKEWKQKTRIIELKVRISMDLLNRKEKKVKKLEKEVADTKAIIERKDEEILRLQRELEKRDILLNNNGSNSSISTSQTSIRMKKVIPNSREKSEKNQEKVLTLNCVQ